MYLYKHNFLSESSEIKKTNSVISLGQRKDTGRGEGLQ